MRLAVFATLLVLFDTCGLGTDPPGRLHAGTWGGDNAGLIVTDSVMHVHIGCTYGYAPPPDAIGANGRFEVIGEHNITAHPVDAGVFHPARFTGRVQGRWLTLTVALTDTAVTLGPVLLLFDQEPRMGPCPICRSPGERR